MCAQTEPISESLADTIQRGHHIPPETRRVVIIWIQRHQAIGHFAPADQSASSVVLPNPAGVHTKTNSRAIASDNASLRRDRARRSGRTPGTVSLVDNKSSRSKTAPADDTRADPTIPSPPPASDHPTVSVARMRRTNLGHARYVTSAHHRFNFVSRGHATIST
jgi:hypothetical protein